MNELNHCVVLMTKYLILYFIVDIWNWIPSVSSRSKHKPGCQKLHQLSRVVQPQCALQLRGLQQQGDDLRPVFQRMRCCGTAQPRIPGLSGSPVNQWLLCNVIELRNLESWSPGVKTQEGTSGSKKGKNQHQRQFFPSISKRSCFDPITPRL